MFPFKQFVFYIPSPHPKSLPIDVLFESKTYKDDFEGEKDIYRLDSVQVKGQKILDKDRVTRYSSNSMVISVLTQKISIDLCVPTNRIHLTSNVDIAELDDNIRIPYDGILH